MTGRTSKPVLKRKEFIMTFDFGNNQNAQGGNRPWRSVLMFRLFIWILGLIVGIVLIAYGQYLLGAVIGGFALIRMIFILSFRGRGGGYGLQRPTQPMRGMFREMAQSEFDVAARTIGTSSAQLRSDFDGDRSIAEIATAAGVKSDTVVSAVVADMSAKIDQAVAEGKVPSQLAARAKSGLPTWAARFVNAHKGEMRGGMNRNRNRYL
jgi:hypothetical protein